MPFKARRDINQQILQQQFDKDIYIFTMQMRNQSLNNQVSANHQQLLGELQSFRASPASIVPYLKERIQRYKTLQGNEYLFSQRHKKKAIQVAEQQKSEGRIRQLIGILLGQTNAMQPLELVPKLDQLALKVCQTMLPQIRNAIQFKPSTNLILRQLLERDPNNIYPSSVACLISLGFDQHYESLANLLIDDGVKSRSNRSTLLNPNIKYVGLASAISPKDPQLRCTVYVLTDIVISKNGAAKTSMPNLQYSQRLSSNMQQQKTSSTSGETGRFPSYQSINAQLKNANQTNFKNGQSNFTHANSPFTNNIQKQEKGQLLSTLKNNQQSQFIQKQQNAPKIPNFRPLQQQSIEFRDNLVSKQKNMKNQHQYFPFLNSKQPIQVSNSMDIQQRNTQNEKIKINFNNSTNPDTAMNHSIDPLKNNNIFENRAISFSNQPNASQQILKQNTNNAI